MSSWTPRNNRELFKTETAFPLIFTFYIYLLHDNKGILILCINEIAWVQIKQHIFGYQAAHCCTRAPTFSSGIIQTLWLFKVEKYYWKFIHVNKAKNLIFAMCITLSLNFITLSLEILFFQVVLFNTLWYTAFDRINHRLNKIIYHLIKFNLLLCFDRITIRGCLYGRRDRMFARTGC